MEFRSVGNVKKVGENSIMYACPFAQMARIWKNIIIARVRRRERTRTHEVPLSLRVSIQIREKNSLCCLSKLSDRRFVLAE